MEAFSDGVIAIIITIMVLEMKVPHGASIEVLQPLWPVFLSYVLSFIYVGIYWNNHHHLLHAAKRVSGGILWANLHLLFWLSLFPFITGWMGENHFAATPTALYGVGLLMAALAFWLLQHAIIASDGGEHSLLAEALGNNLKGKLSVFFHAIAIGIAFYLPWLAMACHILVALMWLIPDRRIENALHRGEP
ncbi:TMEM175 family protein [Parachitinimonas caeni]|uniref:TMEM175 family protein n=1 Tax=Parachitinimonas caeni TaxID=3031301 RepID=UPI0027E5B05E|nr:TMEM175 family protein [Parachitinimonas caeni]